MGQTVKESTPGAFTCPCPLCGEEIEPATVGDRAAGKWLDLFAHRDLWRDVADAFAETGSIDETASSVSLPREVTKRILEFLCLEVCGCRRATCVSCLDDSRSEL